MNREPFSKSDVRLTFAVVAVIALCSVYIRLEYDKAFPQASIQLRLSKGQVTAIAERFLGERGLKTAGFRELTVFDPDDDARLYLERELGLQRANQLMQNDISVWRWRARWYRPPKQEEMLVYVSPDQGRITGFEHITGEAAPGPRLPHDRALELASRFLNGITARPMHIVEDRLEQRPNRYDYLFTWEQDGFRAKEATYRRTVVVQGDQIGKYLEFLYVPENWRREFAAMRSKNELYAAIAGAFWLPLVLVALFLLVRGLRRREIPWRPLVLISGVVGTLMIASQLNSLPLLADRFPTSSPYFQTLILVVLMALGSGVGVFFYVIIAGAAGDPIYRQRTRDPLSLGVAFTRNGLATRRFYRAVIVGYGFAAAHIAFLVAFYLIGRRFGVWSPQDVQYSDLLSTAMPWIYPVAIASLAATSEEFWFRLLAIPVLERLLRARWIAVVIPAFVWGFLHANYPQQPAYVRGIEVGLIGVAAGFIMLRFGILATLVWHYTVDAVLIGGYLFGAPSWFYRLNGAIVALAVLAPLIVSVVLYRRNRGFATLDFAAAPPFEAHAPIERVRSLEPAPPMWPARWLYAAAGIAGLLALLVSPRIYGDWIRVRLDRPAAEAIARRSAPKADRWRTSTGFVSNLDPTEFEYLRRIAGPDEADRIVREAKPTGIWRTRFYRPLEKQEWRIYVDQSGRVIRTDHILDERAPGDRLPAEAARARAQSLLGSERLVLVDSSEEQRQNRTDWSFVFEDPRFHTGQARARTSLELHGSEPSNLRRFLKLPEDWLREFQKPRLSNFVVPALIGSLVLPLLIIFLRRLGSHETVFHWRAYSMAGVAGLLAAAAANYNQWPAVMSGYDTAATEQNYITQFLIGRVVLMVVAAVGIFGLVLALDVFRQAAAGNARLPLPSMTGAAAVAVLLAGAGRVSGWALDQVPGPRSSLPVWSEAGLDTYLPGLAAITQGYFAGMVAVCCAGILVFAALRFMRPPRRWIAASIALAALALSPSLTAIQFIANCFDAVIWFSILTLIVRTCASDLVGVGVAVFWMVALRAAAGLIEQPSTSLRWNGIAAATGALLTGIAVIALAHRGSRLTPNPAPEPSWAPEGGLRPPPAEYP